MNTWAPPRSAPGLHAVFVLPTMSPVLRIQMASQRRQEMSKQRSEHKQEKPRMVETFRETGRTVGGMLWQTPQKYY